MTLSRSSLIWVTFKYQEFQKGAFTVAPSQHCIIVVSKFQNYVPLIRSLFQCHFDNIRHYKGSHKKFHCSKVQSDI